MKGHRSYAAYLRDMLDAAEQAIQFTTGIEYPEFVADRKTAFAVARALEIIGEASKKVPKAIRGKRPDVPWSAIAGIRDRLIHGYFEVDTDVVWRTVREDLPVLTQALAGLLDEVDQGGAKG